MLTSRRPVNTSGTWQYNDTVAAGAVATAFRLGYRHVDTALGYNNQEGVGKALAAIGLDGRMAFHDCIRLISKRAGSF